MAAKLATIVFLAVISLSGLAITAAASAGRTGPANASLGFGTGISGTR